MFKYVAENAGQGMQIGWMEAFVYNADLYCEDCGRAIRKEVRASGNVFDDSDSDSYPQGPYPDGGGESDGPQHCGAGEGCLNAMTFVRTKIGVWLGNPLTSDGVAYLKEMLANPNATTYQKALHEFWSDVYSDYLGEPSVRMEATAKWVRPSPTEIFANGKPLVVTKIGRKYTVHVMGNPVTRDADGKLTFVGRPGAVPGPAAEFKSKDEADGVAHRIGHYMLGLGDFVDTYVEHRNAGAHEMQESGVLEEPNDLLAFNTTLAKLMQRLKKDAGAESISQNYRGTGTQAFRRQLWVRFKSGAVIDLWLENSLGFGGVVMNRPPGNAPGVLPKRLSYDGKTPEEVYAEAAKLLKEWATPDAGNMQERRGVREPKPVDDPDYIIQGLYSDSRIESEFGFNDQNVALDEAKKLLRAPWFEGDYVRIITRDGELFWDSRGGEPSGRGTWLLPPNLSESTRHTVREVNFQPGERLHIYLKGPGGPFESFWYTVHYTRSLKEVALDIATRFIHTPVVGMFIEIVSPTNSAGTQPRLKWTFQVGRHAGQLTVTRVKGTSGVREAGVLEDQERRGMHTVREVNFQQGERLRIRSKGPQGQPFESFVYTVDYPMTLTDVAMQFAQTGQPGMFIEIVSGKLKWTFQQGKHAGQPSVTLVPNAGRRVNHEP